MTVSDTNLRALIRYIPMARALKGEVDRIANMELYEGNGDLVAASFRRLLAGVARLDDDPYLAGLGEDLQVEQSDKRQVTATQLGLAQLLAYLESETGVASGGGGNVINFSKQPVHIGQVRGPDADLLAKVLRRQEDEEEG